MKYPITFLLFILSLGYAGYYLYMFDKEDKQTVSIKTTIPTSYNNKLLTKQFWLTATVQDVMQNLLVKEKKLHILVRTDNERTPLHYAVKYSQDEKVIPIIINAGVNPLAFSHAGDTRRTALHTATSRKTKVYEFTKELLKYYPNIDIRDLITGASPLHWASYYKNSPKVIKLLLDSGADVNAKTSIGIKGITPLMLLVLPDKLVLQYENQSHSFVKTKTKQLLETLQIFLEYNADITIKNERGETALDYMAQNEQINKTELFKKLYSKNQQPKSK